MGMETENRAVDTVCVCVGRSGRDMRESRILESGRTVRTTTHRLEPVGIDVRHREPKPGAPGTT